MKVLKSIIIVLVAVSGYASNISCSGEGYTVKVENKEVSIDSPSGSLDVSSSNISATYIHGLLEPNQKYRGYSLFLNGKSSTLRFFGKKQKTIKLKCSRK